MSKGLEALEYIGHFTCFRNGCYKDKLNAIENELKALDIIRKKNVNIKGIKLGVSAGVYNVLYAGKDEWHLTQEEYELLEYELLKEVLE